MVEGRWIDKWNLHTQLLGTRRGDRCPDCKISRSNCLATDGHYAGLDGPLSHSAKEGVILISASCWQTLQELPVSLQPYYPFCYTCTCSLPPNRTSKQKTATTTKRPPHKQPNIKIQNKQAEHLCKKFTYITYFILSTEITLLCYSFFPCFSAKKKKPLKKIHAAYNLYGLLI